MPARIIGMIGVTPPQKGATLLVIEGEVLPSFVVEFARAHEEAGFDMVLVGYSSSSAEGFLVAMHAAGRTDRLSYLVAHRPEFLASTLFARKVATFDQLSGGRLALHIITGKTDAEQEGDGGALEMGAAECDVFAIYAEPRATTAERISAFRARGAKHGRVVGFNMSVRPIIAETEGAAWDKAHRILAGLTGKLGWARQEGIRAPVDNAGRRQFAFAPERSS